MTTKPEGSQEAIQSYFNLKKIINRIFDEIGYVTSDGKIRKFTDILATELFAVTMVKLENNKPILKFRNCSCGHTKDVHSNSRNRCLRKTCNCKEYLPQ